MSVTATEPQLKKILIIEDEGDICLLLNIMLKKDEIDLEHVRHFQQQKNISLPNNPT